MALVTRRKGLCVSYAFSGQHETHKNITGAIFQCLKLSRSETQVYLTILLINFLIKSKSNHDKLYIAGKVEDS